MDLLSNISRTEGWGLSQGSEQRWLEKGTARCASHRKDEGINKTKVKMQEIAFPSDVDHTGKWYNARDNDSFTCIWQDKKPCPLSMPTPHWLRLRALNYNDSFLICTVLCLEAACHPAWTLTEDKISFMQYLYNKMFQNQIIQGFFQGSSVHFRRWTLNVMLKLQIRFK